MNKKLLYAIPVMIVLAGCMAQKNIKPEKYQKHQEVIAKFADLPDAPFQAKLENIITSPEHHDQVQMFYSCMMPMIDLIDFYGQQMERLGWQLLGQSDIHDAILLYGKPEQFCTILIHQNQLIIYVGNKKGA